MLKSIWILAWVFAGALLSTRSAYGASPQTVDVIPAPARVAFGQGVFAVRAGTVVSIPRNPGATRIARYFNDLMDETRHARLSVVERSDEKLPRGASVLRVSRPIAGESPESYSIDVSAQRVVLSAADPRGLFYSVVTLWQLSTQASIAPAASTWTDFTIPAQHISDSPRFPWRGLDARLGPTLSVAAVRAAIH